LSIRWQDPKDAPVDAGLLDEHQLAAELSYYVESVMSTLDAPTPPGVTKDEESAVERNIRMTISRAEEILTRNPLDRDQLEMIYRLLHFEGLVVHYRYKTLADTVYAGLESGDPLNVDDLISNPQNDDDNANDDYKIEDVKGAWMQSNVYLNDRDSTNVLTIGYGIVQSAITAMNCNGISHDHFGSVSDLTAKLERLASSIKEGSNTSSHVEDAYRSEAFDAINRLKGAVAGKDGVLLMPTIVVERDSEKA